MAVDGQLAALAGTCPDSSGMGLGERDHEWDCKTEAEAKALVKKLELAKVNLSYWKEEDDGS